MDPATDHRTPEQHRALAALAAWPRRRDALAAERAELIADVWNSGVDNVRELARIAGVARPTAYADLRTQGIDPTRRAAAADEGPADPGRHQRNANRALEQILDTHRDLPRLDWTTTAEGLLLGRLPEQRRSPDPDAAEERRAAVTAWADRLGAGHRGHYRDEHGRWVFYADTDDPATQMISITATADDGMRPLT